MPILYLTTAGDPDWPGVRHAALRVLVYKHSPNCGLSWFARRVVRAFAARHPDLPVVQVDVLAERSLSATIAGELATPHESPQVILLWNGRPVWTASHTGIELEAMERAWNEISPPGQPAEGPDSARRTA